MDVEKVPARYLKTTLQRSMQALKRHRDIYSAGSPENRPASIIITTPAARAFPGTGSMYEVLLDVTEKMPTLIGSRNGVWWVANPLENFADRWRSNPGSAERFFNWVAQAHADFASIGEERGVDRLLTNVAKSFGEEPARRAARLSGSSCETHATSDASEWPQAPACWARPQGRLRGRYGRTPSTVMRQRRLNAAQQAFALRARFPDVQAKLKGGPPPLDGHAAADAIEPQLPRAGRLPSSREAASTRP